MAKWGDRPHWTYRGVYLGSDEHGDWLGCPVGTHYRRPEAEFTADFAGVVLGEYSIDGLLRYGAPEPGYAPVTLADRVTGLHAVYSVTAALYSRERTGHGQAIVVPMFEALAQFVLGDHMSGLTFQPPLSEAGYARLLTPHRKPYATSDGMLCVLIYNDKHWRSFFAAIGESEGLALDPRFGTHSARAANIDAVYAEVSRLMRTRTTAEWRSILDAADVPNMPMNSPEDLLASPQLRTTGFVRDAVHPTEGPIHVLAHPTRWSMTPPARDLTPAPLLGEHTREILDQVGYRSSEIDEMLSTGAAHAAQPVSPK